MWGRMSNNIPHRFSPDHPLTPKKHYNTPVKEIILNKDRDKDDLGDPLKGQNQKCFEGQQNFVTNTVLIPGHLTKNFQIPVKEINNNEIEDQKTDPNSRENGKNLITEAVEIINQETKEVEKDQKNPKGTKEVKKNSHTKRKSLPNIFEGNKENYWKNNTKNQRCNSSLPSYKLWGQMTDSMEFRFSPDHLNPNFKIINTEENEKIENVNPENIQNSNSENILEENPENLSFDDDLDVISCYNDDNINHDLNLFDDKCQELSNDLSNICQNVTSQNDIVNNFIKNTNHYHENSNIMENSQRQPYKCCISAERLNQLRKIVDTAVTERKIFIVKGGYNSIRNALLQRGWLEKVEIRTPKPTPSPGKNTGPNTSLTMDDVCANLPTRQEWESPATHIAKCEKMIISRLLQNHDVDFYWNLHKDCSEWQHRLNKNKIINRFSRSLFTSKEGLCLLLQQMYWHNEPGVSYVRFPRCYTINFADQCSAFVEDFRMTACISLLKWFVTKINKEGEFQICTSEGKVPITCIKFAIDRCNDYVNIQKHLDIDKEFHKVWDHEWEQFITNFHLLIHQNQTLAENSTYNLYNLENTAKQALKNIGVFWPQFELDGIQNVWIMKPGNKCRGKDIKLIKDVSDVLKVMNNKLKYVVQKYIERPLLIYNTKFDIRQWFMVTCVQPLTVWMYRDCYLRFSSRKFNLNDFHEAIHLTNNAIQYKYTVATERDKALPSDNMWDNHTFKAYLRQIGQAEKWYKVIYPGMRESIVGAMLASQDTMDRRPNTFELYGADFMIAENFTPWLIEINSCPAMGPTTSVTARMCPQCFEDVIKVVIDRRRDPKADTGLFELVYRQNLPNSPAYLGMMLSIKGKQLFKKRSNEKRRFSKKSYSASSDRKYRNTVSLPVSPKRTLDLNNYKGPIIENLMETIHENLFKTEKMDVQNQKCSKIQDINNKRQSPRQSKRYFKSNEKKM